MLKILFLILIVIIFGSYAQAQKKPNAYKFFGYKNISQKVLNEKVQSFCSEIDKTNLVGWIVIYGSPKSISNYRKQVLKTRMCRQEFPSPRIIFLNIEIKNNPKLEFWIVPNNEEPPINKI